jgi:L-iditol 2-dehydrogenase
MQTKVAKLTDTGQMDIVSESVSDPSPDEVLVEMKRVGICGSDLNYFNHGGLGSHKKSLPLDMGHEPAGKVVDPNGSDFVSEGSKVAIEPGLHCGECSYCMQGKINLCQNGKFMGTAGEDAAFREYINVNESQLIPVDDNITLEEAVLVEPLSVPYHAINNLANIGIDDSVAVFGAGQIGLLTITLLQKATQGPIFVVDPLDYRVEHALKHGADAGFSDLETAVEKIRQKCPEPGVDFTVHAAGSPDALNSCIRAAKPAGSVLMIGIPAVDNINYNPHKARIKELTIKNVRRSNNTMKESASMIEDGLEVSHIITHGFGLDKIQEAFELTSNRNDKVIKTIVEI